MENKLKSAIYGFAVGDALGVPYEFKHRDTFRCVGMIGHGTWDQPAGTWSDDTSMVLATMDAFRPETVATLNNIMENFAEWYVNGKYTPYGNCFDIGGTTKEAILEYLLHDDPNKCGGTNELSNGNGALMRILPFAFFDYDEEIIDRVAALTHNTSRSKFACEMYIKICQSLITTGTLDLDDPYFITISNIPRERIRSTGYVLDSLVAALWCFLTTDSYDECVLAAVNLGNDTDTIAALAGALAGIKYGYEDIPVNWINRLANKKLIDQIVNNFQKSQDKST